MGAKKIVYVISNSAFPGWLKVGITINLQGRLKSYQTGDPLRRYKVEYSISVDSCREYENFLYQNSSYEWVQMSVEDCINAIDGIYAGTIDTSGCERKYYKQGHQFNYIIQQPGREDVVVHSVKSVYREIGEQISNKHALNEFFKKKTFFKIGNTVVERQKAANV